MPLCVCQRVSPPFFDNYTLTLFFWPVILRKILLSESKIALTCVHEVIILLSMNQIKPLESKVYSSYKLIQFTYCFEFPPYT